MSPALVKVTLVDENLPDDIKNTVVNCLLFKRFVHAGDIQIMSFWWLRELQTKFCAKKKNLTFFFRTFFFHISHTEYEIEYDGGVG